ncbi:MAG: alpha/beta hydrolase [Planctomycetes bacterium]|nr:alpha/beta hydrolase [Planctomycetota bacterium]
MRKGSIANSGVFAIILLLFSPASAHAADHAGEWKRATFDGIGVDYLDCGPKDAQTLLFIHGSACNATFWRWQIEVFSSRYRCIALDLPGFGQSDKPRDVDYTMGLFAKGVKAVVDDAGAVDMVLIGHSMGFAVARQFMIDNPGVAKAVASVDGTFILFPDDPAVAAAMDEMMTQFTQAFTGPNWEKAVAEFVDGLFYNKTPPAIEAIVRQTMLTVDPYVMASSMAHFVEPEWWRPQIFTVPCFALYSENPAGDAGIDGNLRTQFPDLTFVLWNDTGHFPMMEKPDRFNAELENFLTALR